MTEQLRASHDGGFRWNAGGWFGAQIGATCWIAIGAALLFAEHVWLGAAIAAVFLAANVIGTLIWVNRSRLIPHTGMQLLLAAAASAGLATVFIVDSSGYWEVIAGVGGEVSARQTYWLILAVFAGLSFLFWAINRQNSRRG